MQLHRTVRAACASGGEFAERVDAGLTAALSFLAADQDLSRELTVLGGDAQTLAAQRRWVAGFGELLRAAAADLPGAGTVPRFRDTFLIDGIRFQIARRVLAGESARLPELRPELLGIVLVFYGEAAPEQKTCPGASALAGIEWEARAG
ncbi:MAG TPA: hypothetical protein VMS11_06985 [Solirubrobacterales bacterium]|nr:hypothetical protein [Solirubrobacterales bacterium]